MYEERLRQLHLFRLEEKRLQDIIVISVFSYLQEAVERARFF